MIGEHWVNIWHQRRDLSDDGFEVEIFEAEDAAIENIIDGNSELWTLAATIHIAPSGALSYVDLESVAAEIEQDGARASEIERRHNESLHAGKEKL